MIGFLSGRSLTYDSRLVAAFHQGLKEVGFVEGQNVAIEFRWAEGQLIGSRRSRPTWLAVKFQ